eukprot:scaffold25065_cov129-Isochrysis_galbana.AAC.2
MKEYRHFRLSESLTTCLSAWESPAASPVSSVDELKEIHFLSGWDMLMSSAAERLTMAPPSLALVSTMSCTGSGGKYLLYMVRATPEGESGVGSTETMSDALKGEYNIPPSRVRNTAVAPMIARVEPRPRRATYASTGIGRSERLALAA